MKRFFIFALVASVFVACSTDATQDLAPEIPTSPDELYVSFDEDSRVQLGENGAPVWTEGDLVSVFYKSDGNDCYKFTGKTGDREGTLKRTSVGEWSRRGDNVVVVYPYSKSYIISLSANTVEASLPAEQTYAKNSYGIGSSLMIATGDYKQFALKNVCGWLKLQFTGSGSISKIVLRGNNGEQVAGNMLVCADDASCILAEASADIGDDEVGGALIADDDILTSVTLNCGEGVALNSETPTAFYIALPPQTFEKGLMAIMYNQDGIPKEISTKNAITIERNHILPMASATLEMPIPSNEIWYTSSDGKVITPYNPYAFGATIISNTYENGLGIITFDGEVTKIGKEAFMGYVDEAETICYNLTNIILPSCITEISELAFKHCAKIKYITIPDCVTTIGDHAFQECFSLTDITIPNSVTSIGDMAFAYSRSLKAIKFPDDDYSIGYGPTYGCSALEQMTGKYTTADKLSLIKDGKLISIATGNITTYNVPDEVVTIEKGLYRGRNSKNTEGWLSSFTGKFATPDGRCLVEDNVLKAVAGKNIGDFTIPDGVVSTTFGVLYGCKDLTSVTIPESVTSIAQSAFLDCINLRIVYCESATPPSLGGKVFDNNASDRKIYTYAECVDVYKAASGWKNYADSIYADGNYPTDGVTTSIFYTTSDEQTVSPNMHLIKIKSNTYNNGVGELVVYGVLKNIPTEAFCMCSTLTSITIPDSVTTIRERAFGGCDSLTAFYGKFASEDNRCLIIDGILKAFAPAGLTTYTIPNSVTAIGVGAFHSCFALISINIPNSVTSIGNYAFYWCEALKSVTIPNSVTEIGDYAFNSCSALKSITIPNSVTKIGSYAFRSCTTLTSVTIPNSVTEIGKYAFYYCQALKEVYCKPTTPPTGGGDMFRNNASGRKICVPTVSVDAYKAASYWSDYADVITAYDFENDCIVEVQPSNEIWYTSSTGNIVTPYATNVFSATIVSNTYENGKGIIKFNGNITSIGGYAFQNCSALASVTIPNSVTSIGYEAFMYCSALESVTIPDSVTEIGDFAFYQCYKLKSFYGKFASADNRCLIIDGVLNSFAPAGLTTYTIPNSVTEIGKSAFSECSALTSITIPDSVTKIGDFAFAWCDALTSVNIPNSVTEIGNWAFNNCSALESVTIPDRVTKIGEYAFQDCSALISITIPDSVTKIGGSAFEGCYALKEVYCKPTTPPTGGNYMFDSNASGRKIYVPTASVDAYKAAYRWSEYAYAIEPYNFTE